MIHNNGLWRRLYFVQSDLFSLCHIYQLCLYISCQFLIFSVILLGFIDFSYWAKHLLYWTIVMMVDL